MAFSLLIDLPTAIVAFIIASSLLFRWLKRHPNETLPISFASAVTRIAVLTAGLFTLAAATDVAIWTLAAIGVGITAALYLLTLLELNLAGLILAGMYATAFFFVQFALGFPAFILTPPRATPSISDAVDIVGRTGTTLSPMTPSGNVEIDGEVYSARTDGAVYLDKGQSIVVTAMQAKLLTIQPSTDTNVTRSSRST